MRPACQRLRRDECGRYATLMSSQPPPQEPPRQPKWLPPLLCKEGSFLRLERKHPACQRRFLRRDECGRYASLLPHPRMREPPGQRKPLPPLLCKEGSFLTGRSPSQIVQPAFAATPIFRSIPGRGGRGGGGGGGGCGGCGGGGNCASLADASPARSGSAHGRRILDKGRGIRPVFVRCVGLGRS